MRTTFTVHPAAVLQADKTQEEECGKLEKLAAMLALLGTRGASASTGNEQNSALVPDTGSALTADAPGVELGLESQTPFAGSTAIDGAASAGPLTQAEASASAGAVSEASDAAGTSTDASPQRAPDAITFLRFLDTSKVKHGCNNYENLFSFYFDNPRTMLEDGFTFMKNDEDFQNKEFQLRLATKILKGSALTFGILVLYMVKGTIYSKLKRSGAIVADAFWGREDLTFKQKIRRVVEEATGETYPEEEKDDENVDKSRTVEEEFLPEVEEAFKKVTDKLMMI